MLNIPQDFLKKSLCLIWLSISRFIQWFLRSRTTIYKEYMDITVVGKTTGGYCCRNNRTSDIVEISSARIQLFSGCSYIAKMKFLVDPATKTEHPVVQFAYNYKEDDAA